MTAMRGTRVLAMLAVCAVACGGGNGNGKDKVTVTGQASTTPPATAVTPDPAAAGPACAEMAEKVIATIAAERSEERRAEMPAMVEITRKRCEEDRWTADSRRCMAGAASRDEARRCFDGLTPAQQEAMNRAEKEMRRATRKAEEADADGAAESAGAAPPPAPVTAPPPPPGAASEREKKVPSPRKAKGAAKPRPQSTDPCEGGEGK
jgi:hypothetical protein